MNERLEGGQRLRGGEGAVPGAMDEYLAQQTVVPRRANDACICLLILVDYESVTGRVHAKYGEIQVAVEGDVLAQVLHSSCISWDARSCRQGTQVLVQTQASLFVE